MPTDPKDAPALEEPAPVTKREDIAVVTTEGDDTLMAAKAAERGHDARSYVLDKEPSSQGEPVAPADAPKPTDEATRAKGNQGKTDADATADAAKPDGAKPADTGDEADDGDGDEAERSDGQPKSRRARKVARLQKQLAAQQARIAELESRARAAEQDPLVEPQLDDFDDWEEYSEAKGKYLAEKKLRELGVNLPGNGAGAGPSRDAESFTPPDSWGDVIDSYDDFDEVVGDDRLPVSYTMRDQLVEMGEEGAETLYYLGKHKDEAKRIYDLEGETAVARELAKLSIKAQASKATGNDGQPDEGSVANVVPRVTNAPPPITRTPGAGATKGREPSLDTSDPEEYRRIRRAQMEQGY